MNILILNWRDIKNPKSGGAEILTHELAKGLVNKGHKVTQFSAKFKGYDASEVIDGVKIIRDGRPDLRHLFSSVHFKAYKYYKSNKGIFDLIIDEVHGTPFFTPLYVKEKKIALICEVAGDIWDITFNFPFNYFGKLIESIYPKFYKGVKVVTISNSSKKQLHEIGFSEKNISVLSLGCDAPIVESFSNKAKTPTLIFVSRLTKSKGVEDAIRATYEIKKQINDIRLIIVGRGDKEYFNYLKKLTKSLRLGKNITFSGFVTEKEKWKLLENAQILLAPSSKEGWGLTVHEAGSRGTPVVGYNVEGLRDVIIDGKNGILCKKNNYKELAITSVDILKNKKLYNKLQKGSVEERKKFTWERTVNDFIKVIYTQLTVF